MGSFGRVDMAFVLILRPERLNQLRSKDERTSREGGDDQRRLFGPETGIPMLSDAVVATGKWLSFYFLLTRSRRAPDTRSNRGKHPAVPCAGLFFYIGVASRVYDHVGQCKRRVPTGDG